MEKFAIVEFLIIIFVAIFLLDYANEIGGALKQPGVSQANEPVQVEPAPFPECLQGQPFCILCGNGIVDAEEQCDGTDLQGQSCQSQGFDAGELACIGSGPRACLFDTTNCFFCRPTPQYHMVAYGTYSTSTLQQIANNFTLVDGLYDPYYENLFMVQTVKNTNPSIPVIFYSTPILSYETIHSTIPNPEWPVINSHEEWFLHDAGNQRIRSIAFNGWVMDPQSTGWKNYFAQQMIAEMQNKPLDGTFGDLVFSNIGIENLSSYPPSARIQSWNSDMQQFLAGIKQQLPEKLFIVNTFDLSAFANATDGIMLEKFCHPFWASPGSPYEYPSQSEWEQQINALFQISGQNKWFLAQSGVTYPNGPPYTNENQIMRFCLGSYLLGKNSDKATYYFVRDDWQNPNDSYFGYFYYTPDYAQSKLGNPIDAYYQHPSVSGVFAREFQNGLVLVNPTTQNKNVSLAKPMLSIDGGAETQSVSLPAHTAQILLNSPLACPT